MSQVTWHNYGYGVNTDKIVTTADKLRAYIDNHANLKEMMLIYIIDSEGYDNNDFEKAEEAYKNYSKQELVEIYANYSDFGEELNGIIQTAIEEETHIPLVSCHDDNTDERFVIMPSYYPWEVTENDALQAIKTPEDIQAIFFRNISALTDQTPEELDWGEQNIEGWG